jgi:hypothetical protein
VNDLARINIVALAQGGGCVEECDRLADSARPSQDDQLVVHRPVRDVVQRE